MRAPAFLGPSLKLKRTRAAATAFPFTEKKVLRVRVPIQFKDDWCWAAVCVGLGAAYGSSPREQCEIVGTVLPDVDDCCPFGEQPGCVKSHTLPPALELDDHFEPPELTDEEHRTFEFVRDQIQNRRPIAVRIDWRRNGSGHFVVIRGYRRVGSFIELYVCDPKIGRKKVPFDEFLSNYQQKGFWERSFMTRGDQQIPDE